MENLITKAEVIIGLQKKGYDLDFTLNNEFLRCIQDGELISPDDFEIAETFLFENEAEADLPFVIYAISSFQNGVKGILMTSYGAFTQGLSIHLWSKLAANLN
ncbi:phosphoribosylpyrophosphate synthetase [Mucilaginibacter aquariorum]|uniref:Phosphoribosylpyrophosphate synthetase n=1 Tax=Mucilaginibacter aquariorum TaxID=2967225 RepID=A0ABT1SXB8_9SPHI|nr:phosphoribosylpyrophosphate synthetase [Mucilaginibacter aquariorum]MCQ6957002.1 phosphoribosylpyrophosphate synthetase [Mucilaginibacter aquariorum]